MARSIGMPLMAIGILGMGLMARADDASRSAVVKKKAQEIGQAILKEDPAGIADLTYPKVIELLGGREKMIAALGRGMKQMKEQGFAMRSLEVGEPGEFLAEGKNTFIVVPTTVVMTAPGGKFVARSYLLGISPDDGKGWTFVDGTGLDTAEKRKLILPKLPEKLVLPEKQKPQFVKDE